MRRRIRWQVNPENEAYGLEKIGWLYNGDTKEIYLSFVSHKDIEKLSLSPFPLLFSFLFLLQISYGNFRNLTTVEWLSNNISYRLFLAHHSILDIMNPNSSSSRRACSNLAEPTYWHLRGCLRLRFAKEDVESV
jgi:hypothetical protein